MKNTAYCRGCRNDHYNTEGLKRSFLGRGCWSLPEAKVVTRWRIGWWVTPDTPGAFTEVRTYDCHHEPGRFSFEKRLPPFAIQPCRRRSGVSPS